MSRTDAVSTELSEVADPSTVAQLELIPETSPAEQAVADLLPIDATPEAAARARDAVSVWFHTFALAPGVYTPGVARDHRYRVPALGPERFAGRRVLDVGAYDGYYSFLAESRGASHVVAVDNEQYVDWTKARFGVSSEPRVGFDTIAGLLDSKVEYHKLDALEVRSLDQEFDLALCFGILHRVSDPIGLLSALADVLGPGGELIVETYGSRLDPGEAAIEVREAGDVYARDDFVYWGFPAEGLRRLGRIVGLTEFDLVDEVEIDGHPRIIAVLRRPA